MTGRTARTTARTEGLTAGRTVPTTEEAAMGLFPDLKDDLLERDAGLDKAFHDAKETPSGQALGSEPVVVVALNQQEPHFFTGQLELEVHYSASLLKATAMWAAHELLRAANELVDSFDARPPPADVITMLRDTFDPLIDAQRVAQLRGVDMGNTLLPRWDDVFDVRADSFVEFTPAFSDKLSDAIANGSNTSAGTVIHGLGFGYLTKAAASAGFFDDSATGSPETADGMWLCGDFANGFTPRRIPCVNDTGPVAQATSARQMARLFTFLGGRSLAGAQNTPLVDGDSDEAMLDLLRQAVLNRHSMLDQDTTVNFDMVFSKVGQGPLNTGAVVCSEAAIIDERSTGRRFVAVFQNRVGTTSAQLKPVSQLVDTTLVNFLFP
ncbi:hypothetical protein [Streptomyces arenae]|uniref:hypothetical protein n=1 Tax=Streptomyces arenae TaxID=29301 RepID=UPI0026593C50|nr:hypothetical protein [Streptomyces arenae]MCG7205179.1 hypothetical protein [Streptomyces arenae]